jgi:hypothetical protein
VYALCRKIRNLAIQIDLQLKLFDSLITPILVYSCEVWGFENKQILESLLLLNSMLFQNVAILNLIIISTGKRPISP